MSEPAVGLGQIGFQVPDIAIRDFAVALTAASQQVVHTNPNRVGVEITSYYGNTDSIIVILANRLTGGRGTYEEYIPVGETLMINRLEKREIWALSATTGQIIFVKEYTQKGGVPASAMLKVQPTESPTM